MCTGASLQVKNSPLKDQSGQRVMFQTVPQVNHNRLYLPTGSSLAGNPQAHESPERSKPESGNQVTLGTLSAEVSFGLWE